MVKYLYVKNRYRSRSILRETAEKVDKIDTEVRNLIAQMRETLEKIPAAESGWPRRRLPGANASLLSRMERRKFNHLRSRQSGNYKTSTESAEAYEGCSRFPILTV